MNFTNHSRFCNAPSIVVIAVQAFNKNLIGDSFLCVSLLGLTVSPPSTLYIYYTLLTYINQLFLTKKARFFGLFHHFITLKSN